MRTSILCEVNIKYNLDPNFRDILKQKIMEKYIKKTYGIGYIMSLEMDILDKELPLYEINRAGLYRIYLNGDLLIVNKGDVVKLNIEIDDKNDIHCYNNYILCKEIDAHNYIINPSKNTIEHKTTNRIIKSGDNINAVITDVFSSDGLERILCNISIVDDEI